MPAPQDGRFVMGLSTTPNYAEMPDGPNGQIGTTTVKLVTTMRTSLSKTARFPMLRGLLRRNQASEGLMGKRLSGAQKMRGTITAKVVAAVAHTRTTHPLLHLILAMVAAVVDGIILPISTTLSCLRRLALQDRVRRVSQARRTVGRELKRQGWVVRVMIAAERRRNRAADRLLIPATAHIMRAQRPRWVVRTVEALVVVVVMLGERMQEMRISIMSSKRFLLSPWSRSIHIPSALFFSFRHLLSNTSILADTHRYCRTRMCTLALYSAQNISNKLHLTCSSSVLRRFAWTVSAIT